jgi:hypothetical protein
MLAASGDGASARTLRFELILAEQRKMPAGGYTLTVRAPRGPTIHRTITIG